MEACAGARKFITAVLRDSRYIALVVVKVHFKSTKVSFKCNISFYLTQLWRKQLMYSLLMWLPALFSLTVSINEVKS